MLRTWSRKIGQEPCAIHRDLGGYNADCLACKEYNHLKADLLDALDLKHGEGPTALGMVVAERDRLREELKRTTRHNLGVLVLKRDLVAIRRLTRHPTVQARIDQLLESLTPSGRDGP